MSFVEFFLNQAYNHRKKKGFTRRFLSFRLFSVCMIFTDNNESIVWETRHVPKVKCSKKWEKKTFLDSFGFHGDSRMIPLYYSAQCFFFFAGIPQTWSDYRAAVIDFDYVSLKFPITIRLQFPKIMKITITEPTITIAITITFTKKYIQFFPLKIICFVIFPQKKIF